MKELYVILLKSHVKGVILTLITTAIGVLSGIVANNITSLMWWMILISVVSVYIISVYKYAILENKQQAELNQMIANRDDNEKRVEILQSVLQGISSMNRISAKQTNLKVHEIIEQGKIYCDNWNFDIASGLVCGQIHSHAISYICKKGFNSSIIDVEVAFVCLIEGKGSSRIKLEWPLFIIRLVKIQQYIMSQDQLKQRTKKEDLIMMHLYFLISGTRRIS